MRSSEIVRLSSFPLFYTCWRCADRLMLISVLCVCPRKSHTLGFVVIAVRIQVSRNNRQNCIPFHSVCGCPPMTRGPQMGKIFLDNRHYNLIRYFMFISIN